MNDPRPKHQALEHLLDETEHQALDLLDGLEHDALGTPWVAPDNPDTDARAHFEQAIVRSGEALDAVEDAERSVLAALQRGLELAARTLLEAGLTLSRSEAAPTLEPGQVEAGITLLAQRPEFAAVFPPAVETTHLSLDLNPGSLAWAALDLLVSMAQDNPPAPLRELSGILVEQLEQAWPNSTRPEPIDPALRVYRSASLAHMSASTRARALAAERPEHLALAQRLVVAQRDPAQLVAHFDEALDAIEADQSKGREAPATDDPPAMDGPKRKFTWVHMVLALLVFGVSAWHYLWR